jgi:hypothetical protein
VPGIGITHFDRRDVVRHPLVARVVEAYEQRDAASGDKRREARARAAQPPPLTMGIETVASDGTGK